MGSFPFVLIACTLILMLQSAVLAAPGSRCPAPQKVYTLKPSCRDDYDCKGGKVCCLNQARALSCTEPAPSHQQDKYYGKYDNRQKRASVLGGPGVYCGHVKCMPFERCIRDPYSGKLVCRK